MEIPLIMKIENARGEILNALQKIQSNYNFPAYILDGILSQIICEIKSEEKMELLNASNIVINQKDKEVQNEKDNI